MTIAGEAVPAEATFEVLNPATGRPVAEAPVCSAHQLDAAMESAAEAFAFWRVDADARRTHLRAAAQAVFDAADDIGPVITAEQGKPLRQAKGEVIGAGVWLKYFASLELPREVIQDDDKAFVEVLRRPLGVVAAITPWNYPVLLAAWKIAPALAAGNTVVVKPSPFTPMSTLALGEALRDALPPGVLNVVSGPDPLGAVITEHPVPRKVSFTGSIATGKRVAAAVAPDLKRITLELGGNDAAIVLDDADPAAIADDVFWAAFQNAGQVCSGIKRLYVPEALRDDMVAALAARASTVKMGDGTDEDTELGPVTTRSGLERVGELVRDAVANGGRVVVGGQPSDGPGYFFPPTIIDQVSEDTRVVAEEQFGPVLPVLTYRDVDDAVARANATHFGLSGSVWSADPERGAQVAERLECGTAWVNTHVALAPHQPFGGLKWSGIGVEHGPWGLMGATEIQVLHRARR